MNVLNPFDAAQRKIDDFLSAAGSTLKDGALDVQHALPPTPTPGLKGAVANAPDAIGNFLSWAGQHVADAGISAGHTVANVATEEYGVAREAPTHPVAAAERQAGDLIHQFLTVASESNRHIARPALGALARHNVDVVGTVGRPGRPLDFIEGVTPVIGPALKTATQAATTFVETPGNPIDRYLAAMHASGKTLTSPETYVPPRVRAIKEDLTPAQQQAIQQAPSNSAALTIAEQGHPFAGFAAETAFDPLTYLGAGEEGVLGRGVEALGSTGRVGEMAANLLKHPATAVDLGTEAYNRAVALPFTAATKIAGKAAAGPLSKLLELSLRGKSNAFLESFAAAYDALRASLGRDPNVSELIQAGTSDAANRVKLITLRWQNAADQLDHIDQTLSDLGMKRFNVTADGADAVVTLPMEKRAADRVLKVFQPDRTLQEASVLPDANVPTAPASAATAPRVQANPDDFNLSVRGETTLPDGSTVRTATLPRQEQRWGIVEGQQFELRATPQPDGTYTASASASRLKLDGTPIGNRAVVSGIPTQSYPDAQSALDAAQQAVQAGQFAAESQRADAYQGLVDATRQLLASNPNLKSSDLAYELGQSFSGGYADSILADAKSQGAILPSVDPDVLNQARTLVTNANGTTRSRLMNRLGLNHAQADAVIGALQAEGTLGPEGRQGYHPLGTGPSPAAISTTPTLTMPGEKPMPLSPASIVKRITDERKAAVNPNATGYWLSQVPDDALKAAQQQARLDVQTVRRINPDSHLKYASREGAVLRTIDEELARRSGASPVGDDLLNAARQTPARSLAKYLRNRTTGEIMALNDAARGLDATDPIRTALSKEMTNRGMPLTGALTGTVTAAAQAPRTIPATPDEVLAYIKDAIDKQTYRGETNYALNRVDPDVLKQALAQAESDYTNGTGLRQTERAVRNRLRSIVQNQSTPQPLNLDEIDAVKQFLGTKGKNAPLSIDVNGRAIPVRTQVLNRDVVRAWSPSDLYSAKQVLGERVADGTADAVDRRLLGFVNSEIAQRKMPTLPDNPFAPGTAARDAIDQQLQKAGFTSLAEAFNAPPTDTRFSALPTDLRSQLGKLTPDITATNLSLTHALRVDPHATVDGAVQDVADGIGMDRNSPQVTKVADLLHGAVGTNPSHFAAAALVNDPGLRSAMEDALRANTTKDMRAAVGRALRDADGLWSAFGVVHPALGAALKRLPDNGVVRKAVGKTTPFALGEGPLSPLTERAQGTLATAAKELTSYDEGGDVASGFLAAVKRAQADVAKSRPLLDQVQADLTAAHPTVSILTMGDLYSAVEKLGTDDQKAAVLPILDRWGITTKARITADQVMRNRVIQAARQASDEAFGVTDQQKTTLGKIFNFLSALDREQVTTSLRYFAGNRMDMGTKAAIEGVNPLIPRDSVQLRAADEGVSIPLSTFESFEKNMFAGAGLEGMTSKFRSIQHAGESLGKAGTVAMLPVRAQAAASEFVHNAELAAETSGRQSVWFDLFEREKASKVVPAMRDEIGNLAQQFNVARDEATSILNELDQTNWVAAPAKFRQMVEQHAPDAPEFANTITDLWTRGLNEASQNAEQETERIFLRFNDERMWEAKLGVRNIFAFSSWATRNIPYYTQTLAANPYLLRAYANYNDLTEQQRQQMGLTSRFRQKIGGVGLPFLSAMLGQHGTIYFNPLVAISIFDQFKPTSNGTSTPLLGQGIEALSGIGLSPLPWISDALNVAGVYGDQDPEGLYRYGDLLNSVYQAATGNELPAPITSTVQNVRSKVSGVLPGTARVSDTTLSHSAYTDYAINQKLRELALQTTGNANDPTFNAAMGQPGSPLYQYASKLVGRKGIVQGILGATMPLQTTILGNAEAQARAARAALPASVPYTQQQALTAAGSPAFLYSGIPQDARQTQIETAAILDNMYGISANLNAPGPQMRALAQQNMQKLFAQFPEYQRYLAWKAAQPTGAYTGIAAYLNRNWYQQYLAWVPQQPPGTDTSIDAYFAATNQ